MSLRSARPIRSRSGSIQNSHSPSIGYTPFTGFNNTSRLPNAKQVFYGRPTPRCPSVSSQRPSPYPTPTATPDELSPLDVTRTITTTTTTQSFETARLYPPAPSIELTTVPSITVTPSPEPRRPIIPVSVPIYTTVSSPAPAPPLRPALLPSQQSTGLFPPIRPPSKAPKTLCGFKAILEHVLDMHFGIMATAYKLFVFFPSLHTTTNTDHLQRIVDHRYSLGQLPDVDLDEISKVRISQELLKDEVVCKMAQNALDGLIGSCDRILVILGDAEEQMVVMGDREKKLEKEMEMKKEMERERKLWIGKRLWKMMKRAQEKRRKKGEAEIVDDEPVPEGWGDQYERKVAEMIKIGRDAESVRLSVEKFIGHVMRRSA